MAKTLILDQFYGGITSNDKDNSVGVLYESEEMDIFENAAYIQPTQIMSDDTLPTDTEFYSFTSDEDDNVWAYGKDTNNNKVILAKVTTGGATNPGAFSKIFTSSDSTFLANALSPIIYHRTSQTNNKFLYYLVKDASHNWKVKQYDITAGTETDEDVGSTTMTLSGLSGTYDRPSIIRLYGELYITHGQYIAKIDKDGVFTEEAFTVPNGMIAVDMVGVSDLSIVLARPINVRENVSKGYFWDLEEEAGFDYEFTIPMGGAQWIEDYNGIKIIMCASNGIAKFYLQPGYAGSGVQELPGKQLRNVIAETSTQPVSTKKSISSKDGILYFTVNKTDKTAIYALGQLDNDKPLALTLAKRLSTTDYSNHTAYSLLVHGYNYYAAYDDDGTAKISRCETGNSPSRSSNAYIVTTWIDIDEPLRDKALHTAYTTAYPLTSGTSVEMSLGTDYASAFTEANRADGTDFTGTSEILAEFKVGISDIKAVRAKLAFTSSTTNAVKLQALGMRFDVEDDEASF